MRKISDFILLCSVLVLFSGCAVKVGVDANQTLSDSYKELKNVLTHGDWLVIRGIHESDNFIAGATNMPLSHAAIYDANTDEAIEADGSGVHTTALKDFLAKSQRVMVIAPIWANEQTRAAAVSKARDKIGLNYNYTGLIGLDTPNSFYCTQLAIDAYKEAIEASPPQNPLPHVVKPGQMYHWGRIIYDSGAVK
ncbi:MAG: hypothetical protein LBP54_03520 [Campylobacteraceae bacterium]|jgi:uncharacterized protein YvpB|nr:hypothetical protein [Campylobacteraceae bacterium]